MATTAMMMEVEAEAGMEVSVSDASEALDVVMANRQRLADFYRERIQRDTERLKALGSVKAPRSDKGRTRKPKGA